MFSFQAPTYPAANSDGTAISMDAGAASGQCGSHSRSGTGTGLTLNRAWWMGVLRIGIAFSQPSIQTFSTKQPGFKSEAAVSGHHGG